MKGSVEYINPDGLIKNSAFTNVAVVSGNVKTIYIGGLNAVNEKREIIGKGNIGLQTEQVMKNLRIALKAGSANLNNLIKWNIYVVQGISPQPALEVFQKVWGNRPNPPLITMLYVAGLANPDFLVEMDAIAVVAEKV
jgi:enamine deaminase RidA (YjgF/YER057c/UK114 family)